MLLTVSLALMICDRIHIICVMEPASTIDDSDCGFSEKMSLSSEKML